MNLHQQIQNITSEFTTKVNTEVMLKVKAILGRNFPFSDVDEMTAFELFEFMEENNLVAEIKMDTSYETINTMDMMVSMSTTVKIFRKEELL